MGSLNRSKQQDVRTRQKRKQMTPKEKAKELKYKMENFTIYPKRCALIAVEEILKSLGHKKLSDSPYITLEARQYYVQVKQEIEKL
jgi:hypothetical protein